MADLSLANTVNQFEEEQKKKEELERQRRESFDQTKIEEANKIDAENEMQGWDYLSYNKKEEFGKYLNSKYGNVSRLDWGKLYNIKLMQDSLGMDKYQELYRKGVMTPENIDNIINQRNGAVLNAQFDTLVSQFKNPETGQYEGLDDTTQKMVSLFGICDNNKKREIINVFKKAAELDKPRQEAFAKAKQLTTLKDELYELKKDPANNAKTIEEKTAQVNQLEESIEDLQDAYGDQNWFEEKAEWVKDWWDDKDHDKSELQRRGYTPGSIKTTNLNKEKFIDDALDYDPEDIDDVKKQIALRKKRRANSWDFTKAEYDRWIAEDEKELQELENIKNTKLSNANYTAANNDHLKRANEAITTMLNEEALEFADKTEDQVQQYLEQSEYKTLSGDDLDAAFEKAIKEDNNAVYQAYWRTRKNDGDFFSTTYGTDIMKHFSDSDKREYLASRDVYTQALGTVGANALLAAQAQDYIASHQTDTQKAVLNSKSIVVGLASNGADIVNGFRLGMLQAMDASGVQIDVCVDANNNIYNPEDVIQLPGAEGKMFVKNEKGETIEVHQTQMSPTQLDALGYDWSDLQKRRSFFNQQYWMKAENYNTFDSKEMDAIDENGGISVYNAQYKNGERRSLIWDASTNAIIGLTDVALIYFSGGLGLATRGAMAGAKGLQFARVASRVGGAEKLLSAGYKGIKIAPIGQTAKVAKMMQMTEKLNPVSKLLKTQSVTSTMYSGQRYSFAGAYQQNLEQLNQKVMADAQQALDAELSTPEGMEHYNQEINDRYMKALHEQGLDNLTDGSSETGKSDPEADNKRKQLYAEIKQQYDKELYDKAIYDVKNTQEYANAFSAASGQANEIAMMSSFSAGLENLIVANAVFRKGVYDSVEEMTQQTMNKQVGKVYKRAEDGTLQFNHKLFKADGSKNRWNRFKDFSGITAKTVGFEMGVGYSQAVFMNAGKGNYTAFDDYLMNHYGEDITADTYTGIGAGQAFLNGIATGLSDEENLRQGLAGIGSFAVNPFNIGWGAGTMLYEGHKIRKANLIKEQAAYERAVNQRTEQLKKEGKSDAEIDEIIKKESKSKSGVFSTESTLSNKGFHPLQSAKRWLAHSKIPIVNYISAYKTQHSTLEMAAHVWRNNILSTYVSDVNAERMLEAQFNANYQLAQSNGDIVRATMNLAALTNITEAGQSKDESEMAEQMMAMEAIQSIERRTQSGDMDKDVSLGDAMRTQMFKDYLGGLINAANKGWDNLSAEEQQNIVTEYITRKKLGDSKNEELRQSAAKIVEENLNNWSALYTKYKEGNAKIDELEKEHGEKFESIFRKELLKHYTLSDTYDQTIEKVKERLQKAATAKKVTIPDLDAEGNKVKLNNFRYYKADRKERDDIEIDIVANEKHSELVKNKLEKLKEEEQQLLKTINDNSHWYNSKKANAARYEALKKLHKNRVDQGKLSKLASSLDTHTEELKKTLEIAEDKRRNFGLQDQTKNPYDATLDLTENDLNALSLQDLVDLIAYDKSTFPEKNRKIIDEYLKKLEDAGVLDDLLFLERTKRRQKWSKDRIAEMESDSMLETVLLKEAEEQNSEAAQVRHIADVIINGLNARNEEARIEAMREFKKRGKDAKTQLEEWNQAEDRVSELRKKRDQGSITEEEQKELARIQKSRHRRSDKKRQAIEKQIEQYSSAEEETTSETVLARGIYAQDRAATLITKTPTEATERMNTEIEKLKSEAVERMGGDIAFTYKTIKHLAELYSQYGPDIIEAALYRAKAIYHEGYMSNSGWCFFTDSVEEMMDLIKEKATSHSLLLDSFMDVGLRDGDTMATVIIEALGDCVEESSYVSKLIEIAHTYTVEARDATSKDARKIALDKARLITKVLDRFQHYMTIKHSTTNPDPMQTPSYKEKLKQAKREFTNVEDSLKNLSKHIDKSKKAFKKAKTDAEKEQVAKQLAQYLNDYNEVWHEFYDNLDSDIKADKKNPMNGKKFKKDRSETMNDLKELFKQYDFEIQDPDYTGQTIRLNDKGDSGTMPNGTKVKVSEVIEKSEDKADKDRVLSMDKVGLKHGNTVIQEVTVSVRKTVVKSERENVQNLLDTIDEIQDSPLKEKTPESAKNKKDDKNDDNKNEPEPPTSTIDFLADNPSIVENAIKQLNYWISQYFRYANSSDVSEQLYFEEAKKNLNVLKGLGYVVRKVANSGDKYKEEFGGNVTYVNTDNPSEHGTIKEISKYLIEKGGKILQYPEFVVYRNADEEQRLEQEKLKRDQEALDALDETPPTPPSEVGDPEGSCAELAGQIATELAKQQLETASDADNPNGLPSGTNKPQVVTDEITGDITTKLQIANSEGKSIEVTIIKPNDSESKDLGNNGIKTNDAGEVMLGNTFYKYDTNKLEASQGRQAVPRQGNNTGTIDNYNTWQKTNNTDIQSIIDVALPEIHAADPNVHIHFMYSKDSLLKDKNGKAHTLLCIEYSGKTKQVYDKYKDRYGGVVRASDGKEYLIIGVAGYSKGKTGESQWQNLRDTHNNNSDYNAWKQSNQGGMYVIPDSYTTITDEGIQSGRLRRSDGSAETKQRSLKDLLESPESNPEGITKEDLVLGYVSQSGQLVIPGVAKGVQVTPLRHQGDSLNAGSNFIIVNKAGKRVPIFIPTPKAADIFSFENGTIISKVPDLGNALSSYIHEAIDPEGNWNDKVIRKLQESLLNLFNIDKNAVEIWLGSDNDRMFEIKNNGTSLFKCNVVDLKNNVESLYTALVNSGAIVKMPNAFSSKNSWWITSGVLTTDVDCLTTVNKGFGINPVNADGTPKHVSLSKKIASRKSNAQVSDDHATGQYLQISGQKCRRFTDTGKVVWKTESGDEISNPEDIRNLEISYFRYNNNNPIKSLSFKDIESVIPENDKIERTKKTEVQDNYEYYLLPNCPYADSQKGDLWRLNKTTGEWVQLSSDAYKEYINSKQSQSTPPPSGQGTGKSLPSSTSAKNDKSKISSSLKKKVDPTIEKMTHPTQEFYLYNDPQHPELKDKYYVDKDGKKYCRVTATKEGFKREMRFQEDPNRDYKTPSTTLGNSVDRFNRDFHKGLIRTKDQIRENITNTYIADCLKSSDNVNKTTAEKEALEAQLREDIQQGKYPEITERTEIVYNKQCDTFETHYPAAVKQDWEAYLQQIADNDSKEVWTDADGITHKMYRVVTDDIHAFGEIEVVDSQGNKYTLPVCGVIDKLMVDDAGNYHLRDFKTRRENKVTDDNKKAWAFQLRMYKDFLEKEYGISIKTCQIEMTYWNGAFEGCKGYPTKPKTSWEMREEVNGNDKIQTLYLDGNKFTAKPIARTERIDLTTEVNKFDTPDGEQRVYHYENFPKEYQELCVPKSSESKGLSDSSPRVDETFVNQKDLPVRFKKLPNIKTLIMRMTSDQKKELLTRIGNEDNLNTLLASQQGKHSLEKLIQNILDCSNNQNR